MDRGERAMQELLSNGCAEPAQQSYVACTRQGEAPCRTAPPARSPPFIHQLALLVARIASAQVLASLADIQTFGNLFALHKLDATE